MATIAHMTVEELQQLITFTVEQRLSALLGQFDLSDFETDEAENRPLDEIRASIEQHRWTPPPGTPSVTEMLREDRDQ